MPWMPSDANDSTEILDAVAVHDLEVAVDVLERVERAAERVVGPARIQHEVLELGRDEVLLDGDLAWNYVASGAAPYPAA